MGLLTQALAGAERNRATPPGTLSLFESNSDPDGINLRLNTLRNPALFVMNDGIPCPHLQQ